MEALKDPTKLPPGVDPETREDLLSDADFEAVFKISREKFKAEPGWRQRHRKKSVMWIQ